MRCLLVLFLLCSLACFGQTFVLPNQLSHGIKISPPSMFTSAIDAIVCDTYYNPGVGFNATVQNVGISGNTYISVSEASKPTKTAKGITGKDFSMYGVETAVSLPMTIVLYTQGNAGSGYVMTPTGGANNSKTIYQYNATSFTLLSTSGGSTGCTMSSGHHLLEWKCAADGVVTPYVDGVAGTPTTGNTFSNFSSRYLGCLYQELFFFGCWDKVLTPTESTKLLQELRARFD